MNVYELRKALEGVDENIEVKIDVCDQTMFSVAEAKVEIALQRQFIIYTVNDDE